MTTGVERQANLARVGAQLSVAFNPSGPVSTIDLFAGRRTQISQVLAAVGQAGQHVILFGERGVGKTSLASLTHEFWNQVMKDSKNVFPIRCSCNPSDTFGSVWKDIAEQISDLHTARSLMMPTGDSWDELWNTIKDDGATAKSVRRFLSLLNKKFIIVIDEFDQISKKNGTVQEFASTIKGLSDYLVQTTIILVGVADTVDALIDDYASIQRALLQVRMPRMSNDELMSIIRKVYDRVAMQVTPDALERMGELAQGLPHYAHRFGQEAGLAAVARGSLEVQGADVDVAVGAAIERTIETIQAAYRLATKSNQKDAIFDKVLLACALTPTDELGYFAAATVRDPLFRTTGKHYDIPQFVPHLKKFSTVDKGQVLQTEGEDWSRRYRFANPLLRPYVVLKGIQDKTVTQEVLHGLYQSKDRTKAPGIQKTLF